MTQLRRPNEKANAIVMAEGIKEVHAMIEPNRLSTFSPALPLVGVEPRAGNPRAKRRLIAGKSFN
jgi:hypothetical protein